MDERERHSKGMEVRRAVLGDAHVDRAEAQAPRARAAFNNGVTRDEIKEVLLQCAIYVGVPAANSAFHMAEQVFEEMNGASSKRN